jgi:curli production assembly/transport component CsgF
MKTRQLLCCLTLGVAISGVHATDLVYVPVNPSFGGNPNNAPGLLATAQATKKHEDQSQTNALSNQSPLAQFNQTLERTVVGQLASAATSKLIAADGKLIPGTLQTANFTIGIEDLGAGMLRVTTTDRITAATTSFMVQQ